MASDYRFPYRDNSFDFVLLISVFTHMTPREMENYVLNVSRVLKKGGKCLATFFLLNETETSKKQIENRMSSLNLEYHLDEVLDPNRVCRTIDPGAPERGLAYEEQHVLGILRRSGLNPHGPVRYGVWPETFLPSIHYQDIILAQKI